MKHSLLAITTVILLLGGVVTIALIQSVEAGVINTTRSNIKSGKAPKDVKGNNNQLSSQSVIVKQYSLVENNCGDGTECSGAATNTIGDIFDEGSRSDVAITADGGSACEGPQSCFGIRENGVK